MYKEGTFMQDYINMLSHNLKYISKNEDNNSIIFLVESTVKSPICPYCGTPSSRCHSKYKKSFDDLPLNNKKVTVEIYNRKMFCDNKYCNHKTFSETYDFVDRRAKKTKRLVKYILDISINMSSISAQNTLRKNGIKIGKSTICTFLKKR